MADFEQWLEGLNFDDGWERSTRVVTDKGAFVLSARPVLLNGKPLRFDTEDPNGSNL